jgi:hypothetical protein
VGDELRMRPLSAKPGADTTEAPSPLSNSVFRAVWIASVVSNTGTWIQDLGAAWLMTSLVPSPLMLALVQAASTAPIYRNEDL